MMDPSDKVTTTKERHWTDAQVRYASHNRQQEEEQGGQEEYQEESSSDDDDDSYGLPWQGHEHVFTKSFVLPSSMEDDENNTSNSISISLQGVLQESDPTYVSTGLTLWRSSELLCQHLLVGPGSDHLKQCLQGEWSKDTSWYEEKYSTKDTLQVLELGAGLGLNGMLLYHWLQVQQQQEQQAWQEEEKNTTPEDDTMNPALPTCRVVMTDGDSNALQILRQNVQDNQEASVDVPTTSLEVQQLIWGRTSSEKFLARTMTSREDAIANTTNHPSARPFDLILASDAIYVLDNVQPFFETLQVLLAKHPHAQCWFSFCSRRQVHVQMQDVLECATKMGFHYEKQEPSGQVDDDLLLYIFTWKD